ncbi:site-specific DNA-methyltransferase [Flavobacterium silvisoli]|uniref:site-specific DNA-methyltransferase (cytosine-N(4)-specific) n=1 Tax=Flavobacterium silvisoli TaxID=2529433 RepID=A0A4Q9YX09_9FLAO|nr:DNA methyltransferase [Flavobacterium silvisoli]TBX68347.1 site-specific DNA-methyltransferase [Flavobacterium silvisoli]
MLVNYLPFNDLITNDEWTFNGVRSSEKWTHGYHRYPAKFLPNIVQKIIETHTNVGDTVADLFAGCGTTLVEAKVHGRVSIGVDINPVAQLITSVKTNPINPETLVNAYSAIKTVIADYDAEIFTTEAKHDRIDYWFFPDNRNKIAYLYEAILASEQPQQVKDFFLVALSNILKNCSRWLQSSTKPQRDPKKIISEPFSAFTKQVNSMVKKNDLFFKELNKLNFLTTECTIHLEDARKTSIAEGSVSAVITSPPYVTSYEYADLHQLTAYWFDYISDLKNYRKNFIGTFYSYGETLECESPIAQNTIEQLKAKHLRTAKEMTNYFNDMQKVAVEMHRILRDGGRAFIVIGNTTYKNIKIESAEIFGELLELSGFTIEEVIKRSIPFKLIPTIRDENTGKFTTLANENSKEVYPEEYIIIAKK